MTAANPDCVHDLLIVGAGPVGLALALALKDAGLDIVLADARSREAVAGDPRDLALAHGSRLTLERLGVWDALSATPIEHIHVSQQGGLGRTLIDADEHGLPALGYVASAGALAAALRAAVDTADALLALDDDTYLARLQAHIGNRVRLESVSKRLRYPLLLRYRESAVGPRTVWLGNAAQTLHPVAGQGFNLALRDVWALADTLLRHCDEGARAASATQSPCDLGTPAVLAAYARSRGLDRLGTIRFTDTLVRVFSNDVAPLRHARGAALFALDVFPPLRNFVARRMMFGARAWP